MAKGEKSTFPGSLRDHHDAVKAETEEVTAKINGDLKKLAKKLRERADKAKIKMESTQQPEKRAVLLRRFELYADAATYLEERLPQGDK